MPAVGATGQMGDDRGDGKPDPAYTGVPAVEALQADPVRIDGERVWLSIDQPSEIPP